MIDLSSVVNRFAADTITVSRSTATTFVDGIAQPVTHSTFTTKASVQPASGRDLLRLEEGERSREMLALFTTARLLTADAASGTVADVVTIRGRTYEVQHVEEWPTVGNFYRSLVMSIS